MTDRKISEQNMETLLKHGLETKNDKGQTALLLACENGSFEKARELIGKGANVNVRDNNGRTPIMIACEKDKPTCSYFCCPTAPKLRYLSILPCLPGSF